MIIFVVNKNNILLCDFWWGPIFSGLPAQGSTVNNNVDHP